MKRLGLSLLPTLGDGAWLVIEGDSLDKLAQEARTVAALLLRQWYENSNLCS